MDGSDVIKRLGRLARRNHALKRTDTSIDMRIDGSFREIESRLEVMLASLDPQQELACMDAELSYLEHDLEAVGDGVVAWALGDVARLRDIGAPGDMPAACRSVMTSSSEQATLDELEARGEAAWLVAAERSLGANASTFAVLRIEELVDRDGLLAQLRGRGYKIEEP